MSAPRHLWSGDWESESSAHADDLAARRRSVPAHPVEAEPAAPAARRKPPRRRTQTLRERLQSLRVKHRRRFRVALLAAALTLLVVGAAYAVSANLPSSKSPQPAAATGSQPWLGVDLTSAPVPGALVTRVVPGSPAAAAGIRPGDVITQLDTEPIVTPAIFVSAISGLQPGDRVDIQLQRGSSQYTAYVALGGRRAGTP